MKTEDQKSRSRPRLPIADCRLPNVEHQRRASGVFVFAFFSFILHPSSFILSLGAQELFGDREDVIPPEIEKMYLKGLEYLAHNQTSEGNWGAQYGTEPAVVGLAVLSMLAHGDDPNLGPYSKSIRRGLAFILKSRNEETGFIGTSMYNHGFATLALAECYGVVQNEPRLGPALQKALPAF